MRSRVSGLSSSTVLCTEPFDDRIYRTRNYGAFGRRGGEGDERALEKLTPKIYRELHNAARRCMARERDGHTLQTTALINELYLRLSDLREVDWQNRAHFFALCARQMRRILYRYGA